MSGISELCVQQILAIAACEDLFGGDGKTRGNKAFRVYDPGTLKDLAKRLNYPVCGVVYGGIHSENQGFDQGKSSYLHIGTIILAESKSRDATQNVDHDEITSILDLLRSRILVEAGAPRVSPTGSEWEFVTESPNNLKDKGFVYFQGFKTAVFI